jgi:hypothetical protein
MVPGSLEILTEVIDGLFDRLRPFLPVQRWRGAQPDEPPK